MDGWGWDFMSLSTVYQAYQDVGRMNMKGSVQKEASFVWRKFLFPAGFKPEPPWSEVGIADHSAMQML